MLCARKGLSASEGIFFGSPKLAFCYTLIYLFGSNLVALRVNISIKCIVVVAALRECSSQDTVEDLYFKSSFGGDLSLWRWF